MPREDGAASGVPLHLAEQDERALAHESHLQRPGTQPPAAALRAWITDSFAGRALAAGALVKLAAFALSLAGSPSAFAGAIDTGGDICLVVGGALLAKRLFASIRRRLLWRVRQKLTLSYIFIGFVPVLLIVAFFLVSGLLLFFSVGSFLLRSRLDALADQVRFMAASAALELEQARSDAELGSILQRRRASAALRYPGVSYAIVPADRRCEGTTTESRAAAATITAGPWAHVEPPDKLPPWLPCAGADGLLAYTEGPQGTTQIAIRAVLPAPAARVRYAVVVDLPVDDTVRRMVETETGIEVGTFATVDEPGHPTRPAGGRPPDASARAAADRSRAIVRGPADLVGGGSGATRLRWATTLDFIDWETGTAGGVIAGFEMQPFAIYRRVAGTSSARLGNMDIGQLLLVALAFIGGLFLVIQIVAYGMGLGLARSITGSVHELFVGTERVRRGDFTYKIPIRTRDQLGELADSFNSMTASIVDLLQEKAEKERLEQELAIARRIQMSLLPQGPLTVPGLALTAHCEPAREVGGDYYDVVPLDEHRIGILVADVAGKGTSAALYMAELKGIVLSLSRQHASPRQLLVDANGIISRHLDSRSFITAIYGVVDLRERTLTCARAGHCPLLYRPGPYAAQRRAQALAPGGLVLGLQIDDGRLFPRLLEEATVRLGPGDLLLFYTDGITEAMNGGGECYGEERLAQVLDEHGDLPPEELRDRIVRDVQAFAGAAPQHDDMTLVLLRVEAATS